MAAPDKDFEIPIGEQADIVRETSELKLQEELSVQQKKTEANFQINLLAGFAKLKPMSFEAHGNTINYAFNNNIAMLNYQFNHYLFNNFGRLGWLASVGYSYSQHEQALTSTVLHILPLNVGISYRGQYTSTQAVMPYLNLTYENWIYFQRGLEEYNTSISYSYGAAALGVAFSLNKIGILNSRNEAEMNLQYKRLNNDNYVVQLGGALAL